MPIREEDLEPLAALLSRLSGVPDEQMAGFVVMIGTFEDSGKPGGRIIASTPSLRLVATMLDVARFQIQEELDGQAELS